mmetsp:Transcript_33131/g.77465  ORF Transcript_33131/g.77465 Transcript_33131/m.77465 type:complete len:522 (-) Transcript_33131:184-1749(-)
MEGGASLEVEGTDVVKIILQFLKENQLTNTLLALQEEAQVSLNTVENVEGVLSDVTQGHWDSVLSAISTLRLPQPLLFDLYEQVVVELLELREIDTARQVLRNAPPLVALKDSEPARHANLESLAARPYFEARDAYARGGSKEQRRAHIADCLRRELSVVPPSRLLSLLGQALKWQQAQGQLPAGAKFDLLRGGAVARVVEQETYVTTNGPIIRYGKKSHAECAGFSPDGSFFVSGSMDGFLEVWDYERGKLRKDLAYQEQDHLMMHDEPVLALAFSRDSELLASGAQDGMLKVWRLRSGQCVRRFQKAHAGGITCIGFSRDSAQIATGSFDTSARVHGLKSGKTLKELRGHTSYVNGVDFSSDGSKLASCSSDGTVRVWDARSSECLFEFRPPQATSQELSVNSVAFMPGRADQLLVCNRSPTVYITTLSGQLVKALSSGKREGGDFVACCVSAQGGWVHCVAEDSHLYSFEVAQGKLQHLLKVHEKDVIGVCIHPHRNLVATWSDEGTLKLWRSGAAAS